MIDGYTPHHRSLNEQMTAEQLRLFELGMGSVADPKVDGPAAFAVDLLTDGIQTVDPIKDTLFEDIDTYYDHVQKVRDSE